MVPDGVPMFRSGIVAPPKMPVRSKWVATLAPHSCSVKRRQEKGRGPSTSVPESSAPHER